MLSDLVDCRNIIVGTKQVLRALEAERVRKIYIANDADTFVLQKITMALRGKEVEIIRVDTMKQLGEACRIDVGAAVAALPIG